MLAYVCLATSHVEAPAGSSVGLRLFLRATPASRVRISFGDAPPSEPQRLSVNLTPPAGSEWDAEAQRLAERTTLAGNQPPMCHGLPIFAMLGGP